MGLGENGEQNEEYRRKRVKKRKKKPIWCECVRGRPKEKFPFCYQQNAIQQQKQFLRSILGNSYRSRHGTKTELQINQQLLPEDLNGRVDREGQHQEYCVIGRPCAAVHFVKLSYQAYLTSGDVSLLIPWFETWPRNVQQNRSRPWTVNSGRLDSSKRVLLTKGERENKV